MERWQGRVALVTGASAGIGRACAAALARAGLRVVVCARRGDRLEALADELRGEGADVRTEVVDLRDTDAIEAMFDRIREAVGGVDALVNNAGLGLGSGAPLTSGDTEAWREMWEVNVLALSVCTREAMSDLTRSGFAGQIVHVASMAAHRVPPGSGMYAATKHAVRALTEGLRTELRAAGSDVRVAAISPGYVETEFAAVFAAGDPDAAARTYGRFPCLQPEDVAEALLYLLRQPPHVQVHDVLMRPTRQPL